MSNETRQRVRESIDRLGYVYHRGAASLRTQRTGLIGLLTTDVANPFFASMTRAFEGAAAEHGHLTMMANTLDDPDRQSRLTQAMLEYPVEAFAYTPVAGGDLDPRFGSYSIPILAVTRRSSLPNIPYLGPDEIAAGWLAGEHLVNHHGYRRLAYLGGPIKAAGRKDRLEGVQQAIRACPDAQLVADIPGVTDTPTAIDLAARLLASGVTFDAVICHSDVVAFAILAALRQQPSTGAVGVIGFDGLPESTLFWPPVTSVAVGPDVTGRKAAEWLVDALNGQASYEIAPIPASLQIRASCGC